MTETARFKEKNAGRETEAETTGDERERTEIGGTG